MERTNSEIQDQIDEAQANDGHFFGLTYEDGVMAALKWVLGEEDIPPMEG